MPKSAEPSRSRSLPPLPAPDHGGSHSTAIVAATVLVVIAVSVWQRWSPEQLAIVLAAVAGCLAPLVTPRG